MAEEDRTAFARRCYRALNALQRKNRFIDVQAGDVSLSRLETFVLIELQADASLSVGELAELLGPNQSTLSRALSSLVSMKLLTAGKGDVPRRKYFRLTSKGEAAVAAVDKRTNAIVDELTERAGKNAAAAVVSLFRVIANGLGQPRGFPRPNESRYRVEQRRITRALGLLSEEAYGSGLSHLSFQILLLAVESGQTTGGYAARVLNAQVAAVSAAIKLLERNGLIAREVDPLDRRSSFVTLTPAAKKLLSDTEKKQGAKIAGASAELSTSEFKKMTEAFELFVGMSENESGRLLVRPLVSEDQRAAARAFALGRLVDNGREGECPEVLFGKGMRSFGLFKGGRLVAAEQWTPTGARRLFGITDGSLRAADIASFQEQIAVKLAGKAAR